MESAKRASVVIIVWHLNFSFFFEKRGSKGKEVKKEYSCSHHQKQQKVQFREKSQKNFSFFIHTRQTTHLRRTLCAFKHTHTHTCFERVNNNNAGVHNLFPVV